MSFLVKIPYKKRRIRAPKGAYLVTPPRDADEVYTKDGEWTKELIPCLGYYGQNSNGAPIAVWAEWIDDLHENWEHQQHHDWSNLVDTIMSRCSKKYRCANGRTVADDKTEFDHRLLKILREQVPAYNQLLERIQESVEEQVKDLEINHFVWHSFEELERTFKGEFEQLATRQRTLKKIYSYFLKQQPRVLEEMELKKPEILTDKKHLKTLQERL